MRNSLSSILLRFSPAALAAVLLGCSSTPPGEKGPQGTQAFYVQVQASREDIRIETNNVFAGNSPLTLKIFGDKGGTFHNFGAPQYTIRAAPASTNGISPTQVFKTGQGSSPGDKIPGTIFFDMDRPGGSFSIDTFPENR